MIFNVDFCRFRVPYFQTCAPYFVWGVGFSLDRVLALGICQSQGWIQYWNLSIHQSSSVWMGSQARLSCGNSEMMGLGHQDHQIREVQLEILIASIVNLARYCLIWIETWELLFQLEERSLAQCFLDHYLIRARAVYKTSCFIVIAYIHCIHPITPPLSLALSLQVAPYSGWWFEICLPLFCTSLRMMMMMMMKIPNDQHNCQRAQALPIRCPRSPRRHWVASRSTARNCPLQRPLRRELTLKDPSTLQ